MPENTTILSGWPAWTIEPVGNYSMLSLARFFINLPRFGSSNATALDVHEYSEHFEVLTIISFAVVIGFWLIFSIAGLCTCRFRRFFRSRSRNSSSTFAISSLIFFVVLAVLSHGLGFMAGSRWWIVLDENCNSTEYAYRQFNQLKNGVDKMFKSTGVISQNMTSIGDVIRKLQERISTKEQRLKNEIENLHDSLTEIKTQNLNVQREMNEKINRSVIYDNEKLWDFLDTMCKLHENERYDRIFSSAFIIITLLLLLAFCGPCWALSCSISGNIFTLYLLLLVVLMLQYLISIGNFCANMQGVLNLETDPSLRYFFDCPAQANFPGYLNDSSFTGNLLDYLSISRMSLEEAIEGVKRLDEKLVSFSASKCLTKNADFEEFCAKFWALRTYLGIQPSEVAQPSLLFYLKDSRRLIQDVISKLDCLDFTPKLYRILNTACTHGYLGLFYYSLNFVIAFFSVTMIMLLSACLYR